MTNIKNNTRAIGDLGGGSVIIPPITQETVKPIGYSVQTYTVNKNSGAASTGSIAYCDSNRNIHCNITIAPGAKYKSISKVLLLLKHNGGGEDGFAVYNAAVNGVLEGPAFTYMKNWTDDNGNVTHKVIDITSRIEGATSQTISIEIESVENSSCSVYTADGSLEVEYLDDDDFIPNVAKVENAVASKGAYSINTRTGKLFYAQNLVKAKGGRMPLDLSVTYNGADCDQSSPNGISTGIKGWTFNYAQTIKTLDRDYILLDSNHKYRRFKPASNDSNVKFDSSGKNGVLLTQNTNGFTVTDGNTMTYNFNTNKRLTEIISQSGETAMSTVVTYNSDGTIASITDGMNDTYIFSYLDNTITISRDNTDIIKITLDNERITKIDYLLIEENYTFTYNTDGMLSVVTETAGNNKVVFTYYDFAAVESVKHYIVKEDGETISDSRFLSYYPLESSVAYTKNSTSKWNAYTTTIYTFNEKGETISSCENGDGGAFKKVKFRSEADHEKYFGEVADESRLNNEKIVGGSFTFAGQKAISGETTSFTALQAYQSDTLTVEFPRYNISNCVFSATLYIANSSYANAQDDSIKLVLQDTSGNEIRTLKFDSKKIGYQIKSTMLQLPRGSNALKAKLIIYGVRAQVVLLGASIYEDKSTASFEYISDFVNNDSIIESDGTRNFYLNDGTFNLRDQDEGYSSIKYTVKDHILTTISRLKNPNSYNIWYNNGENVLYQVGPQWALEKDYTMMDVSDVKCCTVTRGVNKSTISIVEESELEEGFIKFSTIAAVAKESTDENGQSFIDYDYFRNTVHYNSQMKPIKSVNENNIVTEYTYNEFGEVLTEKVYPTSNPNLNILSSRTYQNGNLASITEKRYDSEYTRMFEYNANDILTNEITSNGQYIYYTHTPDGEKLTQLSANAGGNNVNAITYSGDLLSNLVHNDTLIEFDYDALNNVENVKIANSSILSKTTTYGTQSVQTLTEYANGAKIKRYYDKYSRLIKVTEITDENETEICKYLYSDEDITDDAIDFFNYTSSIITANSKLRVFVDHVAGTITKYIYNKYGELEKKQTGNINEHVGNKDEYDRVDYLEFDDGTVTVSDSITYENNYSNEIQRESIQSPEECTDVFYSRDALKRIANITVTQSENGYERRFSYIPRGTAEAPEGTTNYIESISYYNVVNDEYTLEKTENVEYNADGNIIRYGENTYEYDRIGRLVRENNKILDKTFVFEYNVGGNIVSKNEYAYTEGILEGEPTKTYNYVYGNAWTDQLTSFDGQSIVYDASGNPTSYLGATLTWSRGRLLTHYTKGSINVAIRYDANGIRMSKQKTSTYTNVNTTYKYDSNGRLRTETQNGVTRRYLYSSDGIVGYEQNGERFLYRKNLLGDIIAIYKGTTKVAEYVYDAWGNCTIVYNMSGYATLNPFRYRGYYWDDDLKMYYLMTRYYDPKTGRFINADSFDYLDPKTINGLNLYSYCNNNPVMNVDPTGHMALSQDTISDIISAVVIILGAVIIALINGSFSKTENPTIDNGLNISFDSDTTPEPVLEGPKLNHTGLRIINAELSARRCDMYLNSSKSRSFYLSLGNLSAFLGAYFDYESDWGMNLGGEISANLIQVGFDGQYIDFSLSFFGIGASAGIRNWKLEAGLDVPKYPGFDFSIDPIKIAQDIVNYFRVR